MGEVDVLALRGVDLALAKGELAVLLGASGSGKSTLLNILGGLDVPTAGSLTYHGRDLTRASERHVNRELGATTAVITHNAAIAAMADRVLQLADGRLVVDRHNAARAAPETLVW